MEKLLRNHVVSRHGHMTLSLFRHTTTSSSDSNGQCLFALALRLHGVLVYIGCFEVRTTTLRTSLSSNACQKTLRLHIG